MPTCRRLAMLECGDSHETPLTRVNSREAGVAVMGKGDRDTVEMVVLLRGGDDLVIALDEGIMDLSPKPEWQAYFFRKKAGEGTVPTTIEMVLNG